VVFGELFASLSENEAKIEIEKLMFEILKDIQKRTKKSQFDFQSFQIDVENALENWILLKNQTK
jgi:hypothetical protein